MKGCVPDRQYLQPNRWTPSPAASTAQPPRQPAAPHCISWAANSCSRQSSSRPPRCSHRKGGSILASGAKNRRLKNGWCQDSHAQHLPISKSTPMPDQGSAADQQVGCKPSLSDSGERAAHANVTQDEDVMSCTMPRVAPEVRNLRREVPMEACRVAACSEAGAQPEPAPDLSGCLRVWRPSNTGV